jgi:hypothetical protein
VTSGGFAVSGVVERQWSEQGDVSGVGYEGLRTDLSNSQLAAHGQKGLKVFRAMGMDAGDA